MRWVFVGRRRKFLVVVEAVEELAAVKKMKGCNCLERERKEKVLTEKISHFR